ncbi:MAG: SCP2 sterol-binding domain-containing protein [Deltaproteobacteria bacterium]|nr:SCP2 sterol-binding domain-containing protein [Deltaproteobacteria bacterium]
MPTVEDVFADMPQSFDKEAADGVDAVILFDITGAGGGKYFVTIRDRALSIVEGAELSPDLVISATAADYIDIATGALNEQLAFMTGRITARGDTRLAMKLPNIFPR